MSEEDKKTKNQQNTSTTVSVGLAALSLGESVYDISTDKTLTPEQKSKRLSKAACASLLELSASFAFSSIDPFVGYLIGRGTGRAVCGYMFQDSPNDCPDHQKE